MGKCDTKNRAHG